LSIEACGTSMPREPVALTFLSAALIGNREFKIPLGAEIGDGRLGIVLDVVLFSADQFAVVRLKDDDVRSRKDNLRILGDVEDFDINLRAARRKKTH